MQKQPGSQLALSTTESMNNEAPFKIGKRECNASVVLPEHPDENTYVLPFIMCDMEFQGYKPWELVNIWYQIGELIGVDYDVAKEWLEQIHWRGYEP